MKYDLWQVIYVTSCNLSSMRSWRGNLWSFKTSQELRISSFQSWKFSKDNIMVPAKFSSKSQEILGNRLERLQVFTREILKILKFFGKIWRCPGIPRSPVQRQSSTKQGPMLKVDGKAVQRRSRLRCPPG